uniref:Secreted protein n=1 Tax=Lates calcarifer TaxID=8187 RepID=A0A4W6ELL6_LATCA
VFLCNLCVWLYGPLFPFSIDANTLLRTDSYTGCEIVMGNLEIAMMEHTRDFSFLRATSCSPSTSSAACLWTSCASSEAPRCTKTSTLWL